MKRFPLLSMGLLFALIGGCHHPVAINRTLSMPLGNRTFALELAATPDAQKAGLADRDSLAADHGLIFVFIDETVHYRIENTNLPLDVIFVNSAGVVVTIHPLNAHDPTPISSDKPAMYAIEINRGAAAEAGIKVGDHLSIPPAASRMAVEQVHIGQTVFDLEVAITADEERIGLMDRDALPAGRGMLFVFAEEQPLEFWMKNTRIPLDIIYLDAAGRIVSIHQMAPFDESRVPSDFPAKYAIELNKDAAAAAGAKVGDRINLPTR